MCLSKRYHKNHNCCCDSSHKLLPSGNLIICIIISEKNNVSVIFNLNFQCFNHLAIVKSSLTADGNTQISCKILVMFGLIYGWILLLVMDIISLLTIIYILTTNWFVLFMVSKEFYFMHNYTIFNSKSSFLTNINQMNAFVKLKNSLVMFQFPLLQPAK